MNLNKNSLLEYGIYDKVLLNKGIVPFSNNYGGGIPTGNVWILEYSLPQPAGTFGIWTDSGIWKSDSVWYN